MNEDYQFSHHFSSDPVFDSVCALYAYQKMDDAKDEVISELADSVVLLDFEEYAWNRSTVKSGQMAKYYKDTKQFLVPKKRKRINIEVCRKGHPLLGNSLKHNGAITCKTCNAEYARKWRRKKRDGIDLRDSKQTRLSL